MNIFQVFWNEWVVSIVAEWMFGGGEEKKKRILCWSYISDA